MNSLKQTDGDFFDLSYVTNIYKGTVSEVTLTPEDADRPAYAATIVLASESDKTFTVYFSQNELNNIDIFINHDSENGDYILIESLEFLEIVPGDKVFNIKNYKSSGPQFRFGQSRD